MTSVSKIDLVGAQFFKENFRKTTIDYNYSLIKVPKSMYEGIFDILGSFDKLSILFLLW